MFSLYSIVLYLWETRLGDALKEILRYITLEAKSVALSSEESGVCPKKTSSFSPRNSGKRKKGIKKKEKNEACALYL